MQITYSQSVCEIIIHGEAKARLVATLTVLIYHAHATFTCKILTTLWLRPSNSVLGALL